MDGVIPGRVLAQQVCMGITERRIWPKTYALLGLELPVKAKLALC